MLNIESTVRKLLPEQCLNKKLSILCLSTSNPVYLIFIEKSSSPDFVIRISQSESICKAHQVTESLYRKLGDLIPEPLLLVKNNDVYITIQKGAKGIPWFQLAEKYSSIEQRDKIHTLAIDALNQFHQATNSLSKWRKSINPVDELHRSYQQCINSGTILPPGTDKQVEQLCESLNSLGEISTFPQHGDFCLNNLIFNDMEIHIIDFEDFGMSFMPLYDQFTLALSFYQLSPKQVGSTLNKEINACVNNALIQHSLDSSFLPGLFLHHILLRLGTWSQNRIEYRKWLLSILEKFNRSPDSFFIK